VELRTTSILGCITFLFASEYDKVFLEELVNGFSEMDPMALMVDWKRDSGKLGNGEESCLTLV